MLTDRTFWKDRRVFVTGHTGFKGSWLCLWLHALGAEVTGYSLEPPTNPSLFDLANISELICHKIGDVRVLAQLTEAVRLASPEVIIHMAAQPLVRESYSSPVDTYATNVMGTVNLLESVRLIPGVRAVVNVTTDKCYENREWPWGYRENEPMGGYDPYSSSKGCSELATAAYRNSFFNAIKHDEHQVAIATARAGNVIGGGDWAADRLIPDCLNALSEGRTIQIRSPHAIRPWQYVLEALSGYLLLAQRLVEEGSSFAEAWNFGPNDADAQPVESVVKSICDLWGRGAGFKVESGDNHHEAHYLKLDCSKSRSILGWQSRWTLEKSLESVVDWHRCYKSGGDIRLKCLDQIKLFEENAGGTSE